MQELSLNILDIAQNSVRAGAHKIVIEVAEDEASDSMEIVISDDGCGMTDEQVQKVIDPFYTTRTTRKVGLGIPFFKMAAEMAGGSFSIESKVGIGTKVKATFVRSHIDRMPLGDMPETICCLMCMNEKINFVYRYTLNGHLFEASSEEFQKVLEGVPLSTPEVMQFVKEYIRENSQQLQNN